MNTKDLIAEMLISEGRDIAFDLDYTLTLDGIPDWKNKTVNECGRLLADLKPNLEMIALVNELADNNTVYIFTARSDIHKRVTKEWLKKYDVRYDYFEMGKPHYDFFIDDRCINPMDLKIPNE